MIPALSMDFPETFKVDVKTTNNRGQTPEEVAERCVNKIIGISDNAHPAIQQQAREYKKNLQKIIEIYNLLDYFDKRTNFSSMARTTGYSCAAVANVLLSDVFRNFVEIVKKAKHKAAKNGKITA